MPEAFKNIIDYVWEQGDSFSERPLCRVDSLVLSQLCYLQLSSEAVAAFGWNGLPLHELWRADWLDDMTCHMYDPPGAKRLIAAIAASPRFRNVRACNYVMQLDRHTDMQFSATTYELGEGQTYVAFRGTDNTVVGWKENLNLALQVQVPSQEQALRYTERIAARVPGRLWLGGHSKGGNIAIYAGMTCSPETRKRIACCFSHDGPGFTVETLSDVQGTGNEVPVDKTIPKSSVFGMLFGGEDGALVVRSASSGFAQHDPLSWEVEGCDFVQVDRLGRTASYLDSSINAWIDRATLAERQKFVDAVFAIMMANDKEYTHEIRENWRTTVPQMVRAARDLDPDVREMFLHKIYELVRELGPGESREARERSEG